jgi:microsomal dipeptidase-like Zn-dependent dipeptidase
MVAMLIVRRKKVISSTARQGLFVSVECHVMAPGTLDWKNVHQQATVVDLHAHPSMKALLFRQSMTGPNWLPSGIRGQMNPLSVRTSFDKLQAGGVDILLSTVYPPERQLLEDIRALKLLPLKYARYLPGSIAQRIWREFIEPTYFEVTISMLNGMEAQVEKYNQSRKGHQREAKVIRSAQELEQLLDQGGERPIAIIHSVEGAHSLQGPISRQYEDQAWEELDDSTRKQIEREALHNLVRLNERGVAYLILAHFYPNKVVTPNFPFPEHVALTQVKHDDLERIREEAPLTKGLTELGVKVVQKMIDLGMMIDISHANPRARKEIYTLIEASERVAPIVLASHVGAYNLNPNTYNLEDWEIRWLAEHGGVIGVIFMTYWLMLGETKFGLDLISQHIEYISQVGGENVVAIGTDFDGADPPDDIDDAAQLPKLTRRLMGEYLSHTGRKYSDAQVQKFLGGNAARMLVDGWGKT